MQDELAFRSAAPGDGAALFEITRLSVAGLAAAHYTPAQIAAWMGDRNADFYEGLIARGNAVVAVRAGVIIGFVDAEPGEVTRLFVRPDAAGGGLGGRLLALGVAMAGEGHAGPVRLEATVNAEPFYRKHGFVPVRRGVFSHGVGGVPIEIVHMEKT